MTEEEAAERAKERIIEIQSRIYERGMAYTNLIMIAGCASAFAIWNITRPQLPPATTIVVATFLGLSLIVFVFFEVYKMAVMTSHFYKFGRTLAAAKSSNDFLVRHAAFEKNLHENSMAFKYAWIFCLWFCVITALAALTILVYNFFVLLVPSWP